MINNIVATNNSLTFNENLNNSNPQKENSKIVKAVQNQLQFLENINTPASLEKHQTEIYLQTEEASKEKLKITEIAQNQIQFPQNDAISSTASPKKSELSDHPNPSHQPLLPNKRHISYLESEISCLKSQISYLDVLNKANSEESENISFGDILFKVPKESLSEYLQLIYYDTLEFLLKKNPESAKIPFQVNLNPLSYAINQDDLKLFQLLLKYCPNPLDLNIDVRKNTNKKISKETQIIKLIFHASDTEDAKILNYLIQNCSDFGFNINLIDERSGSVLHYWALNSSGNPNSVLKNQLKHLIAAGADVNLKNRNNESPLMLAISKSNFKLAHLLFKNGANPVKTYFQT